MRKHLEARNVQSHREVRGRQQTRAALYARCAGLYEEPRWARAELEQRVADRTAELARTNASLWAEIAERRQEAATLRAELALAFADRAAIAIENAGLFGQIHRRSRELEALVALSSALRQVQTSENMLALLVEKAMEVVEGDAGALFLLEGSALRLAAGRGLGETVLGRQHPTGDCAHLRVARTGEPLFIPQIGRDDALCPFEMCRGLTQGMASAALLPLKTAHASIGLLHIAYRSRRDFSADDRRLHVTVTEIAANALYRASVMETLEQRVADRTRELAALYDVTAVSSRAQDLRTTLEQSLSRVLQAMQSSSGAIHLLGEADGIPHLAVQHGSQLPAVAPASLRTFLPQVMDWVIEHGEPFVIPRLVTDPEPSRGSPATVPSACAGVPMRAGGRTLGVLSVVRDAERQFNVEEVALLATIADQVAVSVENARLHKQAEQAAVMEERSRLARELHDSVTQTLYSTALLADVAVDCSAAEEWERVKHYLSRIGDNIRQALKEMRLLLFELQPPASQPGGLVQALSQRLSSVEGRAGVQVRLLADEWAGLPAPVEENLYRIAQEALNNALKHAGATLVTVMVHADLDGAQLEVIDNGKGFDVACAASKGGLGLLSMRQRAEKLGGRLAIFSTLGEGTRVGVSLTTADYG
jgi:signal transduction histidine kinase